MLQSLDLQISNFLSNATLEIHCSDDAGRKLTTGAIVIISIISLLLFLSLLSTIYHLWEMKKSKGAEREARLSVRSYHV